LINKINFRAKIKMINLIKLNQMQNNNFLASFKRMTIDLYLANLKMLTNNKVKMILYLFKPYSLNLQCQFQQSS